MLVWKCRLLHGMQCAILYRASSSWLFSSFLFFLPLGIRVADLESAGFCFAQIGWEHHNAARPSTPPTTAMRALLTDGWMGEWLHCFPAMLAKCFPLLSSEAPPLFVFLVCFLGNLLLMDSEVHSAPAAAWHV